MTEEEFDRELNELDDIHIESDPNFNVVSLEEYDEFLKQRDENQEIDDSE